MKFYLCIIFILAVFVEGIVSNQDKTAASAESTCGVFLNDVGAMGTLFEDMYLEWAIGQMELQNRISKVHGGAQRVIDPDIIDFDEQRDFLMEFCNQNPDKEFVDGVLSLYELFPENEQP